MYTLQAFIILLLLRPRPISPRPPLRSCSLRVLLLLVFIREGLHFPALLRGVAVAVIFLFWEQYCSRP